MLLNNKKYHLLLLILLWIIVQFIAYYKFGIVSSVDTDLYVFEANVINQGSFPEGRSILYSSYILILAVLQFLHIPIYFIVLIQILFSGIALVCIYKITDSLSQNSFTSLIACLLYIFCFKIHQWNMIIYTDSLFTSCSVISFFLLYFSDSTKKYVLTFLFIGFTFFLRPTGIGLLLALISYLYFIISINKKTKIVIFISFFVLILIGINFMMTYYISSFIDSYAKAEIIYPNVPLLITPPNDLYIPSQEKLPLLQFIIFLTANFFYVCKLIALKGFLFIIHAKPYYSIWHNLIIILFLLPVYFFAIKGIKLISSKSVLVFFLTFILVQISTVSLTSENWDGRFLFPILPFIFILASFGITHFIIKLPLSLSSPTTSN